jgi:hypothetical protein
MKSDYPSKPKCPWCKKHKVHEPHSFAVLAGGALLMDRKNDSGGPDEKMDGYLSMSWHGAHDRGEGKFRDIYKMIYIAKGIRGGQYGLYFCSTACMRAFLNYCVDELEHKIE